MSSCTPKPAQVFPHGSHNHYANLTSKQHLSQALENSKLDDQVIKLGRSSQTNYTIHPNSITNYTGGAKHIECPITNKKHSIHSKAGKQIIYTYKKHLSSKNENKCSFTKIKNPLTNRYVSIYGKIGRSIIKNYK